MKQIIFLLSIVFLLTACKNENTSEVIDKKGKHEELVLIENGLFTEYYPGKKQIKFQGKQNNEGEREGQWIFYAPDGTEMSIAHYKNGKKHGHTIVKYPNGAVHYLGEFFEGKEVGIWRIYDDKGIVTEKDYGNLPAN